MFRIKHTPTGRYFGHPYQTVSEALFHLKVYNVKGATSIGTGKIWTRKKYAEIAFNLIQKIYPREWELVETK